MSQVTSIIPHSKAKLLLTGSLLLLFIEVLIILNFPAANGENCYSDKREAPLFIFSPAELQ